MEECLVCGFHVTDLCHVKSKGAGGPDEPFNILRMCRACHGAQHRLGWGSFLNRYPQVKEELVRKGWEFTEFKGRLILSHPFF